jgi:hypothetical protein
MPGNARKYPAKTVFGSAEAEALFEHIAGLLEDENAKAIADAGDIGTGAADGESAFTDD